MVFLADFNLKLIDSFNETTFAPHFTLQTMNSIENAAELLWQASVSKKSVDPVRTLIGETDIESAYKIQERIHPNLASSSGASARS